MDLTIALHTPTGQLPELEHHVTTWLRRFDERGEHRPVVREFATHMRGRYVATLQITLPGSVGTPDANVLIDRFASDAEACGFHVAIGETHGSITSSCCPSNAADADADAGAERTVHDDLRDRRVEHDTQCSGRLVIFEGHDELPMQSTVATITGASTIDEVRALGAHVTDETEVLLDGFVRPQYEAGQAVLYVTARGDGLFRTYETADPHQCCGGIH